MTNRLGASASPYLRSHADNPVQWYPWGEEAFAEARRRDVPVLISIGYATCHWCHVMARESFSDEATARALNAGFVSIKVDREEHPDVDSSYLAAASAFTKQLGWPLNVVTTPDGRAFFAGTYFPPDAQRGLPAFRDVLDAISAAWANRRDELEEIGSRVTDALHRASAGQNASALPDLAALRAAGDRLAALEDRRHGGFGTAPKFPVAPVLGFLASMPGSARELGARTLQRMGASALRDPVEGGFFRYATQADWSEPHYERMLTDNAQLLAVAVRTHLAIDARWPRLLAEGVAGYLQNVLAAPGGGFASGQDSESTIDGERTEGGYYAHDADGRAGLEPPPLDAKLVTGWNGLAIGALARAGFAFDDADALASACAAADRLLAQHLRRDGTLVRASLDGQLSPARATIEDVGMLAGGLLELALATGDPHYGLRAQALIDSALDTASGHDTTFAAPGGSDPVLEARGLALASDPAEGALPSGLTACADAAWRLHLLGAGDRYRDAAQRAMREVAGLALANPLAFGGALELMSRMAQPIVQLVTVVPNTVIDETMGESELARATRRAAASVATIVTDAGARAFADAGFALFAGRTSNAGPLAYFCREFVCALPVATATELAALERTIEQ